MLNSPRRLQCIAFTLTMYAGTSPTVSVKLGGWVLRLSGTGTITNSMRLVSEVFEIDYTSDEIENVDHRRQGILKGLVKRLNV